MQPVPQGGDSSTIRIRERLEARVSALADSMVRRNSEALARESDRIRAEATEHLAAQCRELVALSRSIAAAEREREARVAKLEQQLRESLLSERENAVPRPLEIPRPRDGGASVANLWSRRDPRT